MTLSMSDILLTLGVSDMLLALCMSDILMTLEYVRYTTDSESDILPYIPLSEYAIYIFY